jgi:hypothetical protein
MPASQRFFGMALILEQSPLRGQDPPFLNPLSGDALFRDSRQIAKLVAFFFNSLLYFLTTARFPEVACFEACRLLGNYLEILWRSLRTFPSRFCESAPASRARYMSERQFKVDFRSGQGLLQRTALLRRVIQIVVEREKGDMKMKKKLAVVALLALVVAANITAVMSGESTTYSFTTINVTTDNFTQLLGVNNSGEIVGYHGSGAAGHPFVGETLIPPSSFTIENYRGSAQTQVTAINTNGATAGFYIDNSGVNHGFTKISGKFVTVDFPDPTSVLTQILSINGQNEVAGYWQNGSGTQFPFTEKAGVFTLLDTKLPSNTSAQATGVNNEGDICGFYVDSSSVNHGFLILHIGTVTLLNFAGATLTQAFGLNNLQQVVGTYNDAKGNMHGFLYDELSNEYEAVNDPKGADATIVNGINDEGEIVGFYVDTTGATDGFLGRIARCTQ